MNFKDYLNSKNSSNSINEEFRTDAEGIKQLQAKQDDLRAKQNSILDQIKELRRKKGDVLYSLASYATDLVKLPYKGEFYPKFRTKFKNLCKEEEELERELEKLYLTHDKINDEINRYEKVLAKMAIRKR